MRFPKLFLEKRNCPILSETQILNSHYMYARHKPGHDWKIEEGLPDFSKIKIEDKQSFNWNIFSIPIWTRFNDKKEYQNEYAVVAFLVETIRYSSSIDQNFENHTLSVAHAPIENNYSHCELILKKELTKSQRRAIRLTLKHKSFVALTPHQEQEDIQIIMDIFNMLFTRILLR